MKKFLSLLTALTLVVSMLSAFTAVAAVNTTVFYNAANDEEITALDGVDSIYATTSFTGRYYDTASVLVAHYTADGTLTKVESIVPVESTVGVTVNYTTSDISVTNTDIVKIFAWTGVDTLKPLLQFPGIISRGVTSIPLPTATVTKLDVAEITTVPLTFAMNFKADPATEAQLLAYGNWYADFELKLNKEATFNLDGSKDGYLAGQYDSWSPVWVTVPKMDITLAADTPLKIMETAAAAYGEPGLKYTYQEVYDRVKDFDCGAFFTEEFLAANPDLLVTLELRMYNPLDESESYVIGETYTFKQNINMTTEPMVLTAENVTAEVPAGVILDEGVTELTLSLTNLDASQSGVTVGENEELDAKDIHIEGVSDKNTTPIIITMAEAAPTGLNKGNLTLYHVEDGVAVQMTEVESKEDLTQHNQFTYDPADGTIVMALATFSEITVVSDTEKAWEGAFDYTWFDVNADSYEIANADQLAAFGALVGGMAKDKDGNYICTFIDEEGNEYHSYSFTGKYIKLISDINLADDEANNVAGKIFYPIGYYNIKDDTGLVTESSVYSFEGIFDGNGNTVRNFYQNTWEMEGDYRDGYSATDNYYKDAMGLFGYVYNGTVKNLTIENFSSDGEFTPTGVVAAYAGGTSTFENIQLENCNPRVYNTGNGGIVGINSSSTEVCDLTFRNITIDQTNKISALWGSYDVGCGGIMGMLRGNEANKVHFDNCHVAAIIDVNNDVCANYQYYEYRYAGMYLGTVNYHTTVDGRTYPDVNNHITATNCTATYGDWNEYWYCELVANSLASYTHDHQFSRLTKISSLDEIKSGETWLKAGNFVMPNADNTDAECYHIMKDSEGNLYQHFHDVADESNPDIYETFDENGDGEFKDLKENRQRYYMPFGQLFTGYGWGVTAIYEPDAEKYPDIDIEIVADGDVTSQKKFEEKDVTTIAKEATVAIGDLFTASVADTKIAKAVLQVYVSPVGEDSTVSATFTRDTSDWAKGTLSFTGTGLAKVTITDYFYCTATTIYVTVGEEVVEEPVDKFVANDVTFAHDLTTIESGIETTLGALFSAVENASIDSSAVGVTVTGDATVTINTTDWTLSTVVLNGTSEITLTITDGETCIPATISVTPETPASVEKWTANTGLTYVSSGAVTKTLGELFTATGNGPIKPASITVSGASSYSVNSTDWKLTTVTFDTAGEYTVTINDGFYCNDATATVTVVAPSEKFVKKFTSTEFMYRVGNQNAVALGSLFSVVEGYTPTDVEVTVENMTDSNVTYTLAESATWTATNIGFEGTGVIKLTISDNGDETCLPTELLLEVVDATNVTAATNATSNNVVLLNDIGSGFTVSGDNTFYGNGFTLNYTGNGQYLNNGLKQGVVTVSENGTLDNVRIVAPIYPAAYLYYSSATLGSAVTSGPSTVEGDKTRYHYQLSAVAASGNATISNCYIYGGRNNIFVNTGDVTVKDTVLENGVVANMQIQSNASHTVTLDNLTTIQYQTNSTVVDTTKVMMGAGIIVGPETTDNPTIVLNGDLKQYNWVTADDENAVSDAAAQKIIGAAVSATDFNHTVNGKTASNLGIIYMNTYTAPITNNTGLPYDFGTVSISGVSGNAYSLKNATADQIYSDYTTADRSTVNGLYQPQFNFAEELGGQYIAKVEGEDEFCYVDDSLNRVVAMMFPTGDTKELDLIALVDIAKYTGQDLTPTITCVDQNGEAVSVTNGKVAISSAGTYTVTYAVTDTVFYDKNGVQVADSKEYSWNVTITVSLKDAATPNAHFDYVAENQIMGYAQKNVFAGGQTQYLPFLAGLKIYDYIGQEEYLRFDGDNDFNKIAKAEITGYTSANHVLIEVTLTDGGVISVDTTARAASGGSTYTGKLQTSGSTLYYVNDGTTSATTTTWVITNYSFTGNNGVTIDSGAVTFANCENGSVPTGTFSTTVNYTVNYDANGGDCGQTVGYATSVSSTVTLPTPNRSGYNFVGWYDAASGGNKIGDAGATYTPSANITLYAQWGRSGTITFNANGGSCATASMYYDGTAITLPEATRDGYWFIGWYDAAEGGNKIGDAGLSYHGDGDMTLYAQWQEQIKYTVTYNANGGSCGTTSATYEGTALTLPTPTRTGYTFTGWYTAATDGTKVTSPYVPTANITLYAQWTVNSYTITVTSSNATVKVNGTAVANNGTVSIPYGTQVTVEVAYTQNNDQSTTITGADNTTYTSPFTMPAQEVTINASSSGSCFTPDTLITMADGTQKQVQDITFGEQILAWDFFTGEYVAKDIALLVNHGEDLYTVTNLSFSDGTTLKFIADHGVFDYDLNKFVYLTVDNYEEYIGHQFVKQNLDGGYDIVMLESGFVTEEVTSAYSITSAGTSNAFAEGMLTVAPPDDFYNWIEMGDKVRYDVEAFQKDVETYGLYTYEDFKDYVTYEQFVDWNGAYLKIPVEKGLFTFDYILELIDLYVGYMPQ